MVLFWLLAIIAGAEILLFVCRQCENTACLICPKLQKPEDRATEDRGRGKKIRRWDRGR